MMICAHCNQEVDRDRHSETATIIWCKKCCQDDVDLLRKAGIEDYSVSSCFVWGYKTNIQKLLTIPQKGA